jgi:hypothetical protein
MTEEKTATVPRQPVVTPSCPPTLSLMMAATLTVMMQVREKAPPAVFRRGLGVRGGGVVVSLT